MSDLTVTLKWNSKVDLDLHFYCHDTKIYHGTKKCKNKKCKSRLDIDMQSTKYNYKRADGTKG